MLKIIIICYFILIFPIFINIKVHFSLEEKKVFYYINLFGFINLFNGYAERVKEGFVIHISKRKAIIIKYSQLFSFRKKIKPLKDYHIINFYTDIYIGKEESAVLPFITSFLLGTTQNFLGWFFYYKKPQFNARTNVFLIEGKQRLEIFCKVTFVLNLLMIFISLVKIFMEKLIYANRNRKQQNY